jgi:hypothetical protein
VRKQIFEELINSLKMRKIYMKTSMKMILTDKQIDEWIEWFEETYKNDASIEED